MITRLLILFISQTLLWAESLAAEEPLVVRHYQHQERYEFGRAVLELALSKISKPYVIEDPINQDVNEGRGELLLLKNRYDLEWISASDERECKLIAIKIPLYRGILGLRLLLVRKEDHEKISRIKTIQELRHYTGGHGLHWQDLPIYFENELPVHANVKYEALFEQLKRKRFDYFHRGINEVWEEYERHKDSLSIADNIMLFYPHPIYFYVSPNRPLLAEDLKNGLLKSLDDGSFRKLFIKFHGDKINRAQLDKRNIIKLRTPELVNKTPILEDDWWLPKTLMDIKKTNSTD